MARKRTYFFMGGKKYKGIEKDSSDAVRLHMAEREAQQLYTQDMCKYDGDERRAAIVRNRARLDQIRAEADGIMRDFHRREVG